ncbi:MAG: hypothetical protein US36_C0017G0001, partial [Candidatus Wolfebacteria bacterium GW2011_GWC1_37_10]
RRKARGTEGSFSSSLVFAFVLSISWGTMRNLVRWSIIVVLLFRLLPIQAFAAQPRGIYAVYPINDPADYSSGIVDQLLGNSAVSGIALRERWMHLEPSDGSYQFTSIDEVIAKASRVQKTVQLILVPGFFSPSWLLSKLPSCEDGWKTTCGKTDFSIPYGPDSRGANTLQPLPLPTSNTFCAGFKSSSVSIKATVKG